MTIYNDGVPVTDDSVVTLAQARVYNPNLVGLSDATVEALICAASSYMLTHPGLTISDLEPPYPCAVQMAASMLSYFIHTINSVNGVLHSESITDYSYTSNNGMLLSNMVIPQSFWLFLSPWIKRSAPAKVHQHNHRHHRHTNVDFFGVH